MSTHIYPVLVDYRAGYGSIRVLPAACGVVRQPWSTWLLRWLGGVVSRWVR